MLARVLRPSRTRSNCIKTAGTNRAFADVALYFPPLFFGKFSSGQRYGETAGRAMEIVQGSGTYVPA